MIGDSLSRDRRDWTDLAALDPLWAVWSTTEFRHGGSDSAAFFRRGEKEITELLGYVRGGARTPAEPREGA